MIVVDTSAVLAALVGRPSDEALVTRLGAEELHAPHLIDVEMLHALRRLARTGDLAAARAEDARADFADLAIIRYPHQPLSDRIWELREALTAYDAAFVALGEALGVPLVTCDRRLASPSDHDGAIELYAGS